MKDHEAIQALHRDQTIINAIVGDLLDNELAGGNIYSTDELAKIIKQKYYPPIIKIVYILR